MFHLGQNDDVDRRREFASESHTCTWRTETYDEGRVVRKMEDLESLGNDLWFSIVFQPLRGKLRRCLRALLMDVKRSLCPRLGQGYEN
jgi:hypothetical protein